MKRFSALCFFLATAALPATAQELTLKTWPEQPGLVRVQRNTDISYEMLARNPENYLNRTIAVKGKVVQALDAGGAHGILRMNVTPDPNFKYFTDTVWVDFTRPAGGVRVLDGDIIEFSGKFVGLKSYQAVSGATIYLPHFDAGTIVYTPAVKP